MGEKEKVWWKKWQLIVGSQQPNINCFQHHQKQNQQPQQDGAELGQALLKLGLDLNPIFCRFGSSGFSLYFIGLIDKIWFGILGVVTFKTFGYIDSIF